MWVNFKINMAKNEWFVNIIIKQFIKKQNVIIMSPYFQGL